jgi:hypothetical protein
MARKDFRGELGSIPAKTAVEKSSGTRDEGLEARTAPHSRVGLCRKCQAPVFSQVYAHTTQNLFLPKKNATRRWRLSEEAAIPGDGGWQTTAT